MGRGQGAWPSKRARPSPTPSARGTLSRVSSPTDHELREILTNTRTIAVLGAHTDPNKPAHYVPAYLHEAGYSIYPVNPVFTGCTMWDRPCLPSLPALGPVVIDMVDVFRRPEALPDHISEILAVGPKVVWLQLGIYHAEFARTLRESGIVVIEDRCTLAEHRRLGIAPRRD